MGPDRRRTQRDKEDNLIVNGQPYQQTPREVFQSCEEEKQSRSCVHSKCAVPVAHRNTFLGKARFHHGVKPSVGISSHPKGFLTGTVHDSHSYLQRRLDCVFLADLTASLQRQGPEQREHKQQNYTPKYEGTNPLRVAEQCWISKQSPLVYAVVLGEVKSHPTSW